MECETLIVAYEQATRANLAIAALLQMGVPSRAIRRHPASKDSIEDIASPPGPPTGNGFFGWLFGHDAVAARVALYRKALDAGGTVVSVTIPVDETHAVHKLLQDYGPVDWEALPS